MGPADTRNIESIGDIDSPGYDIAGTVDSFNIDELRGERALDTHTNY